MLCSIPSVRSQFPDKLYSIHPVSTPHLHTPAEAPPGNWPALRWTYQWQLYTLPNPSLHRPILSALHSDDPATVPDPPSPDPDPLSSAYKWQV